MDPQGKSHEEILFAVYSVQLGFASPTDVADASIATGTQPGMNLAERLQRDGIININQRNLIEQRVRHEMHDSCSTLAESSPSNPPDLPVATVNIIGEVDSTFADSKAPLDAGEIDPDDQVTKAEEGRYTMRGVHGRGGQARIMLAFDEHVGREVAIKELLPDGEVSDWNSAGGSSSLQRSTPGMVRFLREARVTGQLEHPNIVPVYELGRRQDNTLYYSMRFVRGKTLARKLKECKSLADRVKLLGAFWDVCNAIAYAHSRGVVHRDIKPENIMVGEFGETVLLDWGVAKVKGQRDIRAYDIQKELRHLQKADEGHTAAGTAIGTPSYMSPEQARGEIEKIDERSDVWGLGAVLYEVLTGRPPYKAETPMMTILMVGEEPLVPVTDRCPDAPPELAAITEKALQKDKTLRHQSSKRFTEEVGAYMTGKRVSSYDYSAWELFKRFARHNKPTIIAVGLILSVIIGALISVSFSLSAETKARQAESQAREREHEALEKELDERRVANFHLAQAYAEKADRMVEDKRYLAAKTYAAASLLHNPALKKSPFHDPTFAKTHPHARALWVKAASKIYRLGFDTTAKLKQAFVSDEVLADCSISPDGKQLAVAAFDGKVRVWDLENNRPLRVLEGHKDRVYAVAYSPNGKLLASAGLDRTVRLWRAKDGKPLKVIKGHRELIHDLDFSPNGRLLASASWDGTVRLWDVAKTRMVSVLKGHQGKVFKVAFHPDGTQMASAGSDGTTRIWNLAKKKESAVLKGHSDEVRALAYSPDGKILATGSNDMRVVLWDTATDKKLRVLKGHKDGVLDLTFSGDGRYLASASYDKTARIWNPANGKLLLNLGGHANFVYGVSFSPKAPLLATSGYDRLCRVWEIQEGRDLPTFAGHSDVPYGLAWSPDGKWVASGGLDKTVRIWDVKRRKQRFLLKGHAAEIAGLAIDPQSKYLASAAKDRTARIWNLKTGKLLHVLKGHKHWVYGVAFSPDSKFLATSSADKILRLWSVKSGKLLKQFKGHEGEIDNVQFSPDGKLLATASYDKTARVWQVESGKTLHVLHGHKDWISGLDFSPDGKTLATSGKDGAAILWDLASGKEKGRLRGHEQWVNAIHFSPDGLLLATASDDKSVRIWSVHNLQPMLFINVASEAVGLDFSPDSMQLALADSLLVKLYSMDFTTLRADPAALLKQSEKNAGLKLDGFDLEVTGVRQ